jgi:hypothetical protein
MGVDRPPTHIIQNRGTEFAIDQLWRADDALPCAVSVHLRLRGRLPILFDSN